MMTHNKVIRIMGLLAGVMAVTAVLGFGISWARAEGTAAPAQAAAAQTGTSFTYQGKLVYNGTAVDGTCDLTFRMYDGAGSGARQVGFNQYKTNVPVNDGFFTVDLDFGSVFSGDARYLQIEIDSCTNGASSVTLSPAIALTGAPYALGLRPGAVISGAVAGGSSLTIINSNPSGGSAYTYGIYGQVDSNDTNATGVYGYASSSSGEVYGVAGRIDTSDPSAAGVLGWSTTGSAAGVRGQTTSSSQFASGVYGVTSNNGFGVWGRTTSSASGSVGVYGDASAASGATYGVYGLSNSASGYGVYSKGNAHVEGQLTWKPITSYVSIPAAAFTSYDNSYTYTNNGKTLTPGNASSNYYLAEVQLPHGATVSNFTFYWTDGATANGSASLFRINLDDSESLVGIAYTSGGGPSNTTTGSSSPSSISNPTVDNSRYAYYIWLDLPADTDGTVKVHGVVIQYTIGQPY